MNQLPIPTTYVKDFNQAILDALIKVKENLWDGEGVKSKEKYICILMEEYIDNENYNTFADAIEYSLDPWISYEGWLSRRGVTSMKSTHKQIQEARHAWLARMIKNTKNKLKNDPTTL